MAQQHRRKKAAAWLGTLHTSLVIGLLLRSHCLHFSNYPARHVMLSPQPLLVDADPPEWSSAGAGVPVRWGATPPVCTWPGFKSGLDPVLCLVDRLSVHQPPHTVQAYQLSEPEVPEAGARAGAVDWWPYTSSHLWDMLDSDQLTMMTSSPSDLEPVSCRQPLSSMLATTAVTALSADQHDEAWEQPLHTDGAWEQIESPAMTYSGSYDELVAVDGEKTDSSESTLAISSHGDSEPLPGNSESLLSMQKGDAVLWNVTSVLRNDVTVSYGDRHDGQLLPSCLTDVSDDCDDRPVGSGMWSSEENSTLPVFSSMYYFTDTDHEEGEKDSGRGGSDLDEEDARTMSSKHWGLNSPEISSERAEGFSPISHQSEDTEGFSRINFDSEGAEGLSPENYDLEGAEGYSFGSEEDEDGERSHPESYGCEGAEGFSPGSVQSELSDYWSPNVGEDEGDFSPWNGERFSAGLGCWRDSDDMYPDLTAQDSLSSDILEERLSKTGEFPLSMADHWHHSTDSVLPPSGNWQNNSRSDLNIHTDYTSQSFYYNHQTPPPHHFYQNGDYHNHHHHQLHRQYHQQQGGSSHPLLPRDVYVREDDEASSRSSSMMASSIGESLYSSMSAVVQPSSFALCVSSNTAVSDADSGHFPAHQYSHHPHHLPDGGSGVVVAGTGGGVYSSPTVDEMCRSSQQYTDGTDYHWFAGGRSLSVQTRLDVANITNAATIEYPVSAYSSMESLTPAISANQPADPISTHADVREDHEPPAETWTDHECNTRVHGHQQQQCYIAAPSASCLSRSTTASEVFTETSDRIPQLSPVLQTVAIPPAPSSTAANTADTGTDRQPVSGAIHHPVITQSGTGHLPYSAALALAHNHTYSDPSVCRGYLTTARATSHLANSSDFSKQVEVISSTSSSTRVPPPRGRQTLSRDERRARSMHLPLTNEQIITLPMDEFNERLSRFSLSDAQLCLIRDIRRRGKNKLAAQNCRRRKLDQIVELADEVERERELRRKTLADHHSLCTQRALARRKYNAIYWHVFQSLRNQNGGCYSPDEYSLFVSDSDSSVVLLSHNNNNNDNKTDNAASASSSPQMPQSAPSSSLLSRNCAQPDVLASTVASHDS